MKLPAATRKQIILDAAVRVANRQGLLATYWTNVAPECAVKTSARLIRVYFPRMVDMWTAIYDDPRFVGNDMGFRPNERN